MSTKKDERTEEILPDAWERFERAVDAAVKSGPKHKVRKDQTKPPAPPPIKIRPS
jgi:hypothetical protein